VSAAVDSRWALTAAAEARMAVFASATQVTWDGSALVDPEVASQTCPARSGSSDGRGPVACGQRRADFR